MKVSSIQAQMPVLRMKTTQQSDAVAARLEEFASSWREKKPLKGDIPPKEAQTTIATFQVFKDFAYLCRYIIDNDCYFIFWFLTFVIL